MNTIRENPVFREDSEREMERERDGERERERGRDSLIRENVEKR
jgi:hypothetical protein